MNDVTNRSAGQMCSNMMGPLVLQAVGGTSVVVVAVVVLIIVLLVWVWMRGGEAQQEESRPQIETGEKPSADILDQREEVDEEVEVDEDMSLAEVKKSKMSKVKGDRERKTAAEATEEAREAHDEEAHDEEAEHEEAEQEEAEQEVEAEDEETQTPDAADENDEKAQESAETEESGLGIPEPSDAGIVDESDAQDVEAEGENRERTGSGISVPTPDDVSEEDIGGSPDETAEDATPDDELADDEPAEEEFENVDDEKSDDSEAADETEEEEPKSLEKGLEKTREGLIDQLSALFTGESIDEEIVEEVEEILIKADVGPKVTRKIIDALGEHLEGEEKNDPEKVWGFIRHYTKELLQAHEAPLNVDEDAPFVILVVGVNGVGKTTSIGKMASKFKQQGKSVLLVAGDTFRAAAVDQLGIWAERTGLPMHQGDEGADPASVIYGGIEKGIEEDFDVILCDTSGRLHTDKNLMEELKKMERVAGNAKEGAPHEVNLVLDANTGQNALAQAEKFFDALDVSGITLTKFDGTARGGVILGICDRFDAPVRYVGIGERVADLREFDADEFVEALFM